MEDAPLGNQAYGHILKGRQPIPLDWLDCKERVTNVVLIRCVFEREFTLFVPFLPLIKQTKSVEPLVGDEFLNGIRSRPPSCVASGSSIARIGRRWQTAR